MSKSIEELEKEVKLLRELIDLKGRLAKFEKTVPYVPYLLVAPVQPYVPYPDPWRPWITYINGTPEITSDNVQWYVDGNRIIS